MKAVVWTRYGPPEVLQVQDIERPAPTTKQMLVKIAVSNVFAGDCELRRFELAFPWSILVRPIFGLFKPRPRSVLGQEYAGEVVEVGEDVTRFSKGDRVFGATMLGARGSYAEYLVSTGSGVVTMPDNLSFAEAAVVTTGGLNALHFLRVAGLGEGGPRRKVLLNGAGGSIGTLAVQIAKVFGANVTAVDATHKLGKLRELGADEVIDYTKEDFTENGELYDAVVDIVGKCSYFRTLKSVKPGGYLVLGNPPFRHLLLRCLSALFGTRRVRFALAGYAIPDLEYLRQLLQAGRIKPVIDRSYPLEQAVEAHRYVETGRRIGNVVLNVDAGLAQSVVGPRPAEARERRPDTAGL
jgi:2-desacetyl-2-hydroxyethyl bacteriochlorophyllide A dehydrogenase